MFQLAEETHQDWRSSRPLHYAGEFLPCLLGFQYISVSIFDPQEVGLNTN